jgi:hypothetical protein
VAGAEQANSATDLEGAQGSAASLSSALREAGPITVMDLEEAKSVTRATLGTSTTLIVATRQAFQLKEECCKVYQSMPAVDQEQIALETTVQQIAGQRRAQRSRPLAGADQCDGGGIEQIP